ncbi:phosphoserine phosphatase SerB [Oceanibium sediminis]|uniref:phosphoserine phosphatase SerB n=1 Tax=Oceanibium sediminis TaxID=2026339 RepID=UPI000DD46764|nr:phosphoserine phosphatase SerB [Oceanibium sediminis]
MSEQVIVVTAEAPLEDAALAKVQARAGGAVAGFLTRRGAGAAEFPINAPVELEALRKGLGVDVNIVPVQGRRKSVLIADMDSTMIPVECIDELADFAGVKPKVAAITEAAMRGELDFEEAIDARVALLRDLPVSVLQECYDTRISLNPGAQALISGVNAAGGRTALVSGGFTFFTERVAAAAGFQSHQANVLENDGAVLSGTVKRPILGQSAKAEALDALCAERGVSAEQVVAIGDGANDLAMIRKAGLGIAYRAKPALRAEADAILDHSDLTAVLALIDLPIPQGD